MALETAMENFSEKRGIIFGSKSPFPFAEVLALRVSESREKSTLVILTASSTNQKLPKTNRAFEMNVSSAIWYLSSLLSPPEGGTRLPGGMCHTGSAQPWAGSKLPHQATPKLRFSEENGPEGPLYSHKGRGVRWAGG